MDDVWAREATQRLLSLTTGAGSASTCSKRTATSSSGARSGEPPQPRRPGGPSIWLRRPESPTQPPGPAASSTRAGSGLTISRPADPRPAGSCSCTAAARAPTPGNWHHTIPLLARTHFRVIAPDMVGFGRTAKPESFEIPIRRQDAQPSPHRFLRGLRARAALPGRQFDGGATALGLAMQRPRAGSTGWY